MLVSPQAPFGDHIKCVPGGCLWKPYIHQVLCPRPSAQDEAGGCFEYYRMESQPASSQTLTLRSYCCLRLSLLQNDFYQAGTWQGGAAAAQLLAWESIFQGTQSGGCVGKDKACMSWYKSQERQPSVSICMVGALGAVGKGPAVLCWGIRTKPLDLGLALP